MRIALLAFPRVQMLDVVGPADVFAEAARQLGNSRAYRISVIGTVAGQIKGTNGLRLATDDSIETFKGAIDTLLIAGSPSVNDVAHDAHLRDWVRYQATREIGRAHV